jgi:hypothetical protein
LDFEEEKEISNSAIVIDHFGHWPSFHDAEVISIRFKRTWNKDTSSAEITVYAFEMTDKLKGKYFEQIKHCLIDIEFIGINNNEIDGFNHQNAVQGISFGREGEYLFCKIEAAYGVDGYIEAKEIKVTKLDLVKN